MKLIILLALSLNFSLFVLGQKRMDLKKHEGAYRIIYVSDTLAFANITTGKSIENKNLYDSSLLLTITDSLITFERDGYNFIDYKYFNTKKKVISIYKSIYKHPLLSGGTPLFMQRIYQVNFNPITKDALVIHFLNIKKMKADYLINENAVKQVGAEPKYYNEYYGELFLIVTRTANSYF